MVKPPTVHLLACTKTHNMEIQKTKKQKTKDKKLNENKKYKRQTTKYKRHKIQSKVSVKVTVSCSSGGVGGVHQNWTQINLPLLGQ